MKGDFTRDTFDPTRHFLRVLMQQGRVLMDSDWNEQVSIVFHYLQSLVKDLIGPHAGPEDNWGFEIKNLNLEQKDFTIGTGHYYVSGILCVNENEINYSNQKVSNSDDPGEKTLVYLDVWERHITRNEDDSCHLRDVALGIHGPDTATRSKLITQVKVKPFTEDKDFNDYGIFLGEIKDEIKPGTGLLQARVRPDDREETDDPCIISPDSKYRGPENQLYRVEIHKGGEVDQAIFKWSRDNGIVTFPISEISVSGDPATTTLELEHLGREERFGLEVGDWVEIIDDTYMIDDGIARNLLQISAIDPVIKQVILNGTPGSDVGQDKKKHPQVRRWDSDGEMKVEVPVENHGWIHLENGVEIKFIIEDAGQNKYKFRMGDYWLIPARIETGSIIWPTEVVGEENVPKELPPHGVHHYYAPLAKIVNVEGEGIEPVDLRRKFKTVFDLTPK